MNLEQFESRLDKTGECWIWKGATARYGYGSVRWDRRTQSAHRIAWQLAYGKIPAGLSVLHRCDKPPCCNPAHLFLGTQKDNMIDASRKGRCVFNPAKGESNHFAKLTASAVRKIRRMYATGRYSYRTLGKRFGVTYENIGHIVKRATWAHVK